MSTSDLESNEPKEMLELETSLMAWVTDRIEYWKSITEYSHEFLKQVCVLEKAHYDETTKLADLKFPSFCAKNNKHNHIIPSFKNLTCYYLNCANAGHSFTVFLTHQAIPQLVRLKADIRSLSNALSAHLVKQNMAKDLEKTFQFMIRDYTEAFSSQTTSNIAPTFKDSWQFWFLFERTLSRFLYHKMSSRRFVLDLAIQIHLELESRAKSTILGTLYEVFLLKSKHEIPQMCYLQELVTSLCEALEEKPIDDNSNLNRVSGLIELIETCTKKTREQEHYSPSSWMDQDIYSDQNDILDPFPGMIDSHPVKQELADVSQSFYKQLQSQSHHKRHSFLPYIPANLRDMFDTSFLSCRDIRDFYHDQLSRSISDALGSNHKIPMLLHGGLVYRQIGFFKTWKPFWLVLTDSNFLHAIYLPRALMAHLKSIHDGSSWSEFVHDMMQQTSLQDMNLDIRFTFDIKFSWTLSLSSVFPLYIDRVDHIISEEPVFRIKFPQRHSGTEKIVLWKCDSEQDMMKWISILNEHCSKVPCTVNDNEIDHINDDEQSINTDFNDSVSDDHHKVSIVTVFEDPWK